MQVYGDMVTLENQFQTHSQVSQCIPMEYIGARVWVTINVSALRFSVNAGFIGERGLWNIEIAADPENDKSKINTLYLETAEDQNLGSQYMHFNK